MPIDKELTKSLLKGPKCSSCAYEKTSDPSDYCGVIRKEPRYAEKCTCKEYKNENDSSLFSVAITTTNWNGSMPNGPHKFDISVALPPDWMKGA